MEGWICGEGTQVLCVCWRCFLYLLCVMRTWIGCRTECRSLLIIPVSVVYMWHCAIFIVDVQYILACCHARFLLMCVWSSATFMGIYTLNYIKVWNFCFYHFPFLINIEQVAMHEEKGLECTLLSAALRSLWLSNIAKTRTSYGRGNGNHPR